MTPNTLFCPSCGARLTVSPNAPQRLMCPRCRAWVENPLGWEAGMTPRPVIPLEYQAGRDAAATKFGAIPLGILLFFGCAFFLCLGGSRGPIGLVFVLLVLVALPLVIIPAMRGNAGPSPGAGTSVRFISKVILGFAMAAIGVFLLLLGLCAAIFAHK